jgi:ATP-dependent Zn protease
MMGTERRSMVMTEDEKRMTAYHEAGHAIVAITSRRPTRSTRPPSSRAVARLAW